MKTYKDLPNHFKLETGETVFIQAYINDAQCDAVRGANEATAERILNEARSLANSIAGSDVALKHAAAYVRQRAAQGAYKGDLPASKEKSGGEK